MKRFEIPMCDDEQELPDWLTDEQIAELEEITDDIIGEGEEAGAPQYKINMAVREAQRKYINNHTPTI